MPDDRVDADRNLLLGALALRLGLISRVDLADAIAAWVFARPKSLAQVLADRGALGSENRGLLEALLPAHVAAHGGDPARSLAAVGPIDLGPAASGLAERADDDLRVSLAELLGTRPSGVGLA